MPKAATIAINTSPLIALIAALGDLDVLRSLYTEVLATLESCQEISICGQTGFATREFQADTWLKKHSSGFEETVLKTLS